MTADTYEKTLLIIGIITVTYYSIVLGLLIVDWTLRCIAKRLEKHIDEDEQL